MIHAYICVVYGESVLRGGLFMADSHYSFDQEVRGLNKCPICNADKVKRNRYKGL